MGRRGRRFELERDPDRDADPDRVDESGALRTTSGSSFARNRSGLVESSFLFSGSGSWFSKSRSRRAKSRSWFGKSRSWFDESRFWFDE
jgi:hypothetical protein